MICPNCLGEGRLRRYLITLQEPKGIMERHSDTKCKRCNGKGMIP